MSEGAVTKYPPPPSSLTPFPSSPTISSSNSLLGIIQTSMGEACDLKVHINGQHTFYLSQSIICGFSGMLRRMLKQEKKRSQSKVSGLKLMGFPGGPDGFELVSRFCYSKGKKLSLAPSNICMLHCSAIFLEMTDDVSPCNLLCQADTFLDGLFYWTWDDILTSITNCESLLLPIADSSGLLDKLISSLLAKISANSEMHLSPLRSFSSSSSSPEFRSFLATKSPDPMKACSSKEWWFDDMTILPPIIIEKVMRTLGAYGDGNKNLILTRFLVHYLKTSAQRANKVLEFGGLADTAVHGVVVMGRAAFSCRGLFWVLRVVSGMGVSSECRQKLERGMGMVLDQATLDDLLVTGHDGGVYDVSLVLRLVRVFVSDDVPVHRMKQVGRLLDKYLGEIAPDQRLKVSKFLSVAESLPDAARDCYDGVYRALDIYLESHRSLTSEEQAMLCRCLNYEKLTLEACKDLAKNPRVPPGVAIQALVSQQPKLKRTTSMTWSLDSAETPKAATITGKFKAKTASLEYVDNEENLRLHLQKMQKRMKDLEKMCKDMQGQMSIVSKSKSTKIPIKSSSRGLPKLC